MFFQIIRSSCAQPSPCPKGEKTPPKLGIICERYWLLHMGLLHKQLEGVVSRPHTFVFIESLECIARVEALIPDQDPIINLKGAISLVKLGLISVISFRAWLKGGSTFHNFLRVSFHVGYLCTGMWWAKWPT